jgi:pantoate--beta-alanine ligase
MEVIRSVARMRHLAHRIHGERKPVGLVPTWGGLHEGHLALVRKARDLCDVSIVSILSNPADDGADMGQRSHPTALTHDVELLVPTGVDYVFAPKVTEFRRPDSRTEIVVRGLTERLFGGLRPRFYLEASTLLVILFHVTEPDVVCLGEKDPLLLAITNQLIADLQFPCQVAAVPIVREQDGAAASWWFHWMTPNQRHAAGLIYRALEKAQVLFGAGERDGANLVKAMRDILTSDLLLQVDYVGVVDSQTLEPLANIDEMSALAAIAATIGEAHLIDNVSLNE